MFSILSSLASLVIHFKPSFNRNMAKTRLKMTFYFTSTVNTFNDFSTPPPSHPLTKTMPPHEINVVVIVISYLLVYFYTPEVKLRTYYGMPFVRLSVRPSVCLSVRPLATSCPLNILKSL